MHNHIQKIRKHLTKILMYFTKKSILYFSRNRKKCENTSISMCDNGGREVKNGPNLCYVIFERSLRLDIWVSS